MKLGVRAHDYGRHKAGELAKLLKAEGFEAAQVALHKAIAGIPAPYPIEDEKLQEVKDAFEKAQIDISVLGCYMNLSTDDPKEKADHTRNLKAGISYAKMLNAGMIGTETSYGVLPMEAKKETRKQVWDMISGLLPLAEEKGVILGIEPVAAHTLYSPQWTKELIQDMKSPNLKIIFDPVNLLTKNRIQDQEELWRECFEAFGEQIQAVHLKDCVLDDQGNFAPCPLGTGLMKYDYLFSWLTKNKAQISVMREEIAMESAHQDILFMKTLLNGET